MNVWSRNTLSLVIASAVLLGCGGGSSDSGPTDNSEEDGPIDVIIDVTNDANEPGLLIEGSGTAMQSLVAPADFLFTNKQSVSMSILSPEHKGQRAHISVYGDYQKLPSGRFYPDENTRIVSGNLVEGLFDGTFVSLNMQSRYLIEIWGYDGQGASQKEVYISDNELVW